MELFQLALLLLAAVLLSSVIDQIVPRINASLVQIALGLLIALFLDSSEFKVDPNLFMVLFIAPLLFYESKELDKQALWENRRPVISLALGLVVVSTLIVGFYLNWLVPSIPLAAAFALGGALSPTDAVAVTSLGRDAKIDPRQKNILESESILNDASGVVSFQFALAAMVTGTFSLLDASISFIFTFFGGILIGLIIAYIVNFIIKKTRDLGIENTTFHVLLELCLPFVVYLVANSSGTSGITAVVAAGLVVSFTPKKLGPSISRLNIVSTSVWKVVTFSLNGIVFVLLGYLLPTNMQGAWESSQTSNTTLLLEVLVVALLLYLVRFVWLFVLDYRERNRKGKRQKTTGQDIRNAVVGTLAGARGAISLSVMMTLPFFISNDAGREVFPQRPLLLFLASGIIIFTLLISTFIVPLLVPKREDEKELDHEESEVIIEMLGNVIEELNALKTSENRTATNAILKSYGSRISRIKETNDSEVEHNKALRIKALRWEQDFVLELIENDELDYMDGYQYLNRLARIQNLIRHRSDNAWVLRNLMRHLTRYLRSVWQHLKKLNPKAKNTQEHAEEMKNTQERSLEYVIKKLQEEANDSEYSRDDIRTLVIEYQDILNRLRNPRPSVTAMAKRASKANEVTRIGLKLELEQIQAMYEAERLSRATAKRLRENVYLMQIDLEDSI